MAPGQPVFDDLRRCGGAEWKRGPVKRFTGRRWNGAEWNRLELTKSGHLPQPMCRWNPSGDSSALVGSGIFREEICLSRSCCREKQEMPGDYYFLLPACLALTASCFFRAALSAWDLCCLDFFCVDFGDLSPIILLLFCVLTGLRHD